MVVVRFIVHQWRLRMRDQRMRKRRLGPLASRFVKDTMRALRWALAVRFGSNVRHAGRERLTAILLSYKRAGNMELIVQSLLRCDFVERVIVHNNGEHGLERRIRARDPRLVVIEPARPRPVAYRWEIARREPAEFFISIDDDVFLRPRQIAALFERLVRDPSVPHGLFGTRVDPTGRKLRGLRRTETRVDHIHRVYTFTRQQIERAIKLVDMIGYENVSQVRHGDDILLSFSGEGKPRVHDLGPVGSCCSSALEGVALWTTVDDFVSLRRDLHRRLHAAVHGGERSTA